MDKRAFLKGLISGAALTGLAVMASTASAADGGDRYQRLVNQQLMLVGLQHVRNQKETWEERKLVQEDIQVRFDELMVLLQTEFDGSPELNDDRKAEMYAKVRQIFNRELEIDTLSEAELRRYENCLVSIATMRFLLAKQRMTFDPTRTSGWSAFSDTYQDVILYA